MTQIVKIPIDKLESDPSQPRQKFYEDELKELAQNIKSEGVINPIEIDDNNIIITGERRWRAAKMAGLTVVPCFVNKISPPRERFKHQLSENIHHNTMSDLDTAMALDKVLKDYGLVSPGDSKTGSGGRNDKGVSWLSEELGKSRGYIDEKLELLGETEEFKKAVEEKEVTPTMVRAIKRTPDKFKNAMRNKILKKEFGSRDVALEMAEALEERPDKAKELFRQDYSKMNTSEAIRKVREIAPGIIEASKQNLEEQLSSGKDVIECSKQLRSVLSYRPITEISKVNIPIVVMALAQLKETIDKYIDGQEVPKVIDLSQ